MALGGALGPAWAPVTPRHFAWQAWHLLTFTFVSRGRRGTMSHPPSFCVAGVALMVLCGALGPDLSPGAPRHFAWQAWHNLTSTFVSRGRRGTQLTSTIVLRGRVGTDSTGWRAWSGLGACDAAALCVAGVALGDIHLRFTWQAWHLVTFTLISGGRRGTIAHPRSFCVAGVAPALTNSLSHTTLSHTIFHTPSFTPNFVTHHLSRTIFHTPHCHPRSLTHHLSHTTLSHTIFDTPSFTRHLCNTPSFTHHLLHPTLSNTIFDTPSFTHRFVTHHFVTPSFTTPSSTHHLSPPHFSHNFVTHHL